MCCVLALGADRAGGLSCPFSFSCSIWNFLQWAAWNSLRLGSSASRALFIPSVVVRHLHFAILLGWTSRRRVDDNVRSAGMAHLWATFAVSCGCNWFCRSCSVLSKIVLPLIRHWRPGALHSHSPGLFSVPLLCALMSLAFQVCAVFA